MKFNFEIEQERYRRIVALKKVNKSFVSGGVLFNQKVLTACGRVHAKLLLLGDVKLAVFMAEQSKFFGGAVWQYYMDWRRGRAKSCAELLSMYKLLNVKLTAHDFVGETYYAGVPLVTDAEINEAIDKHATPDKEYGGCERGVWMEKVGIDGELHPVDDDGVFPETTDFNDIYGDGTMVTKAKLDNYCKED